MSDTDKSSLTGRKAIVTGGTTGIGAPEQRRMIHEETMLRTEE